MRKVVQKCGTWAVLSAKLATLNDKLAKRMDGKLHRKVLSCCSQFHTSISVLGFHHC